MANYERLSGLDACFLGFETANAYMHVAVTAIFERGPLGVRRRRRHRRASGSTSPDGCRSCRASASGSARAGRARRDLGRRRAVRPRASRAAREPAAARLDRAAPAALRRDPRATAQPPASALGGVGHRRPRDGGFALVVKVHHCIVDGIAGIGMLAALLDVDADRPRRAPTRGIRGRRRPRASCCATSGRRPAHASRSGARSAARRRSVAGAGGSARRPAASGGSCAPGSRRRPRCPSTPIGPHRQVAWRQLDLGREGRRAPPGRHRQRRRADDGERRARRRAPPRGEPVPDGPLRAVVPVSVRTAEEFGAPGNRVSLWLVPLPVSERDPRRRFATIHATTEELKRSGEASGGAVIAEAANWAGGAVVERRRGSSARPASTT